MKPTRIQRKSTNGWRMPPNTLYCGRPTMWGNPFDTVEEFENSMYMFGKFSNQNSMHRINILENIHTLLKHKHLACWCPVTSKCHVDILIKLLDDWDDWRF